MTVSIGTGKGDYVLLPYDMEHWGETQTFSIEEQPEGAVPEVGATGTIFLIMDQRKMFCGYRLRQFTTRMGRITYMLPMIPECGR